MNSNNSKKSKNTKSIEIFPSDIADQITTNNNTLLKPRDPNKSRKEHNFHRKQIEMLRNIFLLPKSHKSVSKEVL